MIFPFEVFEQRKGSSIDFFLSKSLNKCKSEKSILDPFPLRWLLRKVLEQWLPASERDFRPNRPNGNDLFLEFVFHKIGYGLLDIFLMGREDMKEDVQRELAINFESWFFSGFHFIWESIMRELLHVGPIISMPLLLDLLQRYRNEKAKIYLVDAIGEFGPEAKEAVPLLADFLQSKHAGLARKAAIALGKIGPAADEVLPSLIQALEYPDILVQWQVAEVIGKMGAEGAPAVPALRKIFAKNPNPHFRFVAGVALEKIQAVIR